MIILIFYIAIINNCFSFFHPYMQMRLTTECARAIGQLRLNPDKKAANNFAKEQLNNAVLELANDLAPRYLRETVMVLCVCVCVCVWVCVSVSASGRNNACSSLLLTSRPAISARLSWYDVCDVCICGYWTVGCCVFLCVHNFFNLYARQMYLVFVCLCSGLFLTLLLAVDIYQIRSHKALRYSRRAVGC